MEGGNASKAKSAAKGPDSGNQKGLIPGVVQYGIDPTYSFQG